MRTSIKITLRHFALLFLLINHDVYAAALPSFQTVQMRYHSSFATLLDRNGETLQTLQLDHSVQRLPWVKLQDLSPAMQDALLVSEDQRFFQHQGVDWRAMAGAAWENLIHNTHRGASTLTMQLAGLLDPALTRGVGGRTYMQKWQQIGAARKLEAHWSKEQILEVYLNLVDYRSNLFGINAATQALFNKTPATINAAEASILSALLRGPNAKPAIVAERACGVAALLQQPRPTCAVITALTLHQLHQHPIIEFPIEIAPEVAQQLLKTPAQRISTSLDAQLQKIAISSLQKSIIPGTSAAAVMLNNTTGEILAYTNTNSSINNVITAHRSATLLQPFIYAFAIDKRLITAATVLDNTPLAYLDYAAYPYYMDNTPEHDWVSMRTALREGLSTPATRTFTLLQPAEFEVYLQRVSLHPANEPNTLLSIANAYQAIANNGLYRPATFHVSGLNTKEQIMPTTVAAILNNILTSTNTQSPDNPIETTNYFTLTSDTHFAVGSTQDYTIAVWIDNAKSLKVTDIWKQITNEIISLHPSHPPALPNELITENINFVPIIEAPRKELFLPGTEQTIFSPPQAQNDEIFSQPDVSIFSVNYQNQ